MHRSSFARLLLLPLLTWACSATDDATPDDTDASPSAFCDALDLPYQPFLTEGVGSRLGEVAGDFTVETTQDPWTFSAQYTGCSSYVFFVHFPGRSDRLMRSDLDGLLDGAPDNVEYFFLSDEEARPDRRQLMGELNAGLNEALNNVVDDAEDKKAWRERFHFVTTRATEVEGGIGDFIRAMVALANDPEARADLGDRGQAPVPLPEVFGIDRDQRYDAGGNLSPYVGAPGDELGMAAGLPHFYNYRHALDARMRDEPGVTVVPVLDELTTGRVFTLPVQLPDAQTMAGFDRLEFDVTIDCRYDNPFACSEWDRIAWVWLCTDGEACTERLELARWITPYWRRGRQRYALDASPMIALLRDGGTKTLYVELGPSWERATEWYAAISMRLSDTGGPRPIAAVPAFGGGGFGAAYNDRAPIPFTPPTGMTKAEVVAIISGHGQTDGNNCAEWCDHRHTFSVGATALPTIAHEGASIGSGLGCAARANNGVIPGQWGNWSQARAYWCPGMAVAPHRLDITGQVTPGTEAQLGYRGSFGTGDPAGGDIALSSYVVFYANP